MSALVERAPEGTRRLLEEFAWDGPVRTVDGGRFVVPGAPEKWAVDHGLIFRPSWNVAEMPREVSLALRGPDYHPPFTPGPPDLGTVPVDPEAVDHLMTLAAPHVVERCAAMLENTAKIPLPLLKAGGVGVREVRRVAKDTGCDEDETRLLLEICAVARLLAWDDSAGGLVPTEKFDRWRLDDAAARLRVLLSAWWRMERSSLRRTDGKYGTVLGDDPAGAAVARARRAVLAVLARLPANTACTDRAGLVGATHWHAPCSTSRCWPSAPPPCSTRPGCSGWSPSTRSPTWAARWPAWTPPPATRPTTPRRSWRTTPCWWSARPGRWPAYGGARCSAPTSPPW